MKAEVCINCQASFVKINKENRCNECMKEIISKQIEKIEYQNKERVKKVKEKRKHGKGKTD